MDQLHRRGGPEQRLLGRCRSVELAATHEHQRGGEAAGKHRSHSVFPEIGSERGLLARHPVSDAAERLSSRQVSVSGVWADRRLGPRAAAHRRGEKSHDFCAATEGPSVRVLSNGRATDAYSASCGEPPREPNAGPLVLPCGNTTAGRPEWRGRINRSAGRGTGCSIAAAPAPSRPKPFSGSTLGFRVLSRPKEFIGIRSRSRKNLNKINATRQPTKTGLSWR